MRRCSCRLAALALSFSVGVLLQLLVWPHHPPLLQAVVKPYEVGIDGLACVGLHPVAQLVADADGVLLCVGADAVPVLWCELILGIWHQQLGKRVRTCCASSPTLYSIQYKRPLCTPAPPPALFSIATGLLCAGGLMLASS